MQDSKTREIMDMIEEGKIDLIYQHPNQVLKKMKVDGQKPATSKVTSQRVLNSLRWESIKAGALLLFGALMFGRTSTQVALFRLNVINKLKKHAEKLRKKF